MPQEEGSHPGASLKHRTPSCYCPHPSAPPLPGTPARCSWWPGDLLTTLSTHEAGRPGSGSLLTPVRCPRARLLESQQCSSWRELAFENGASPDLLASLSLNSRYASNDSALQVDKGPRAGPVHRWARKKAQAQASTSTAEPAGGRAHAARATRPPQASTRSLPGT